MSFALSSNTCYFCDTKLTYNHVDRVLRSIDNYECNNCEHRYTVEIVNNKSKSIYFIIDDDFIRYDFNPCKMHIYMEISKDCPDSRVIQLDHHITINKNNKNKIINKIVNLQHLK